MQSLDSATLETALAQCAREKIQFSGAIQPGGFLIACTPGDWRVRHASANCEALFGLPVARLLDLPLDQLLDETLIAAVEDAAAASRPGQPPMPAGAGNLGPRAQIHELGVHRADDLVHIEIEPQGAQVKLGAGELSQQMIARLVHIDDEDEFHRTVAEQVRLLTGFDRVMVYRFLHDDSGEVIAEARASDVEPYLGLRYPASDIPPQARALYLRNRIRVIPDVAYVPVPIEPPVTADGRPLDLSQHQLRSVSPVHLAYLRNMGVAASMSVSLIVEGRLWGLIACHHRGARAVTPSARGAADLFGLFVSMRIAARELHRTSAYQDHARQARDQLEARLIHARVPTVALTTELPLLLRALPSDGVALLQDGQWHTTGRVPDTTGLEEALRWIERQPAPDLHMSAQAAQWRIERTTPPADGLAGVLALPIRPQCGEWLLFFRREQIEDVRWAGRPDAAFQIDASGLHIGPRASFSTWRETYTGHSRPWTRVDTGLAERLRLMLLHRYPQQAGSEDTIRDLAGRRTRLESGELQHRLVQLVELSHGLEPLDHAQAHELLQQVDRLRARLHGVIGGQAAGES